jgi:ribosomal protein S27E
MRLLCNATVIKKLFKKYRKPRNLEYRYHVPYLILKCLGRIMRGASPGCWYMQCALMHSLSCGSCGRKITLNTGERAVILSLTWGDIVISRDIYW